MPRSAEEILALYKQRRLERSPLLAAGEEIRRAYGGDIVFPLPEMGRDEQAFAANLVVTGIDQTGMRIASTMPDIKVPPDREGFKGHDEAARIRRKAMLGWWEDNRLPIKMRRRARWYVGYAAAPVLIRPDADRRRPEWVLRHPLCTFPAVSDDPDDITPPDCIFSSDQRFGNLMDRYPDKAVRLHVNEPRRNPDHRIQLLEYVDDEEYVLVAVGHDPSLADPTPHGDRVVELERSPNRTGMCLAVTPTRITLDGHHGQFDQAIGPYKMRSMLLSLEVLAAKQGVFPQVWFSSNQLGQKPEILQLPDWRTGEPGVVKNAQIDVVQINPSFTALQNIDRMERDERIMSGVPAEFGGEAATGVRTGARGEQIISATVDFGIQEAHTVFEESLREENRRAIAVQKAYFPGEHSFYVSWKGARGRVDYDTEKHLSSDVHTVEYAFAGSDLNGQTIRLGQKAGIGEISMQTMREMDPEIEDPEVEHDRIIFESLERAVLAALEAQALAARLPLEDIAFIAETVKRNRKELFEAVMEAQKRAQERQAQQVAPEAPEAQPGLSQPGAGSEASVASTEPSLSGLANLLGDLRRPQMRLAVEG